MSDDSTRPIVIKRVKKVAGGHHGGAWKIAYADFVTAMMAFFLLMWLLGSTSQGDLKGISDFFQNPLKLAATGGRGSGDATSVLQGGGKDLTKQVGQVKQGDIEKNKQNAKESSPEFRKREQEILEALKGRIDKLLSESPQLIPFKNQILLDYTAEGLRIQIVDEQNRPMFDSASAELKSYTRELLRQLGRVLNGVDNRMSLAGHTDAAQFGGGERGFSNWELSANRANASRRELIVGGMDESKILRVVGQASTVLYDRNDPLNPVNRRISIVVLNKKTEMAILQEEGPESVVTDPASLLPQNIKVPAARGAPG